jgi:hypothetical protein
MRREPEALSLPIGGPKYDPASPLAIKHGCTCDPDKNRNGKGQTEPDGTVQFYPRYNCPVHGLNALRELVQQKKVQH